MKAQLVPTPEGEYLVYLDGQGQVIKDFVTLTGEEQRIIPWGEIGEAIQNLILDFVNDHVKVEAPPTNTMTGLKTYAGATSTFIMGAAMLILERIGALPDREFMITLAGVALIASALFVFYARDAAKGVSRIKDIPKKLGMK